MNFVERKTPTCGDLPTPHLSETVNDLSIKVEFAKIEVRVDKLRQTLHRNGLSTASQPTCLGVKQLVRDAIQSRANRLKYLPSRLLSDPAWDILLDLYSAKLAQVRVPVNSLCMASNVPPTTAMRWIKSLEEEGLINRTQDLSDARRRFVGLTEAGSSAMIDYFEHEAARAAAPMAA